MRSIVVPFLLVLCTALPAMASVTCKDKDGNFVDWWFMYKTPEVSTGRGYGYVYFDAEGRTYSGDIGDNSTALKETIFQLGLYGQTVDRNSVGWVIWNDQTYQDINSKVVNHEQDPNGKYYAHSKVRWTFLTRLFPYVPGCIACLVAH